MVHDTYYVVSDGIAALLAVLVKPSIGVPMLAMMYLGL